MEKALTFKNAADEAAYYRAEIDELLRAMERSEKRRLKIRADSERLKAETRVILARIGAK